MNKIYAELFVEVMIEKIPPHAQEDAEDVLLGVIKEQLSLYNETEDATVKTIVSPNRICFVINNLPSEMQKKNNEIKGPEVGVTDEILEKFAQKHNKSVDELEKRAHGKGEFWFAVKEYEAEPFNIALPELIQNVLNNMPWKEYMDWGPDLKWIRPARKIVAIFNGSPMIFRWEKANLDSLPYTNPSLTSEEELVFDSFASYKKRLSDRNIFIDYKERVSNIVNQVRSMLTTGEFLSNNSMHVIEGIARLVESPIIHKITMLDDFNVPDPIAESVLVHHEQCIPVMHGDSLSHSFFKYSNYVLQDEGAIFISDVSHSVRARLKNAGYFWTKDCSLDLEDYVELLNKASFYENLGTYQNQTNRFIEMAEKFFHDCPNVKEAANWVNIDLAMETVFEIPELHGIVSGLYAETKYQISSQVSKILKNLHYLEEEDVDREALLLGFIQNLDIIVGFIGIGNMPKGSSDPFGIRRAASILVKIGLRVGSILKINDMIDHLIDIYQQQNIALDRATKENVISFIKDRLSMILREKSEKYGRFFVGKNISWDEIQKLQTFLENADEFMALMPFYIRLSGITNNPIESEGQNNPPKEYLHLVQILQNKKSKSRFTDIANACNDFFESSIKIKDLSQENIDKVLQSLNQIKNEFDDFCNFKGISQLD
jgi:glycyl-tRNA synthetase beta chain